MAGQKKIWIESYDYFKAGNRFAGSAGALGFKIFPDKEPPQLRVLIWEGPNCCGAAAGGGLDQCGGGRLLGAAGGVTFGKASEEQKGAVS